MIYCDLRDQSRRGRGINRINRLHTLVLLLISKHNKEFKTSTIRPNLCRSLAFVSPISFPTRHSPHFHSYDTSTLQAEFLVSQFLISTKYM